MTGETTANTSGPEGHADEDGSVLAALRIEGLSKTFPGQIALDDLDMKIGRGEIHALVGQNGSGKSTLIKLLSGFHHPDPGCRVWIGGDEVPLGNPAHPAMRRITFVHQDPVLVQTLSIRENLGLKRAGWGLWRVDARQDRDQARRSLRLFGLQLDPDAKVSSLTAFEKAVVTLVRAIGTMQSGIEILVLDEPTASLGITEKNQLFELLRRITSDGVALLYVTHFLDEVFELADRVTVLRDGRCVAVEETASLSEKALVKLMLGADVEQLIPLPMRDEMGQTALTVIGLEAPGLIDVNLEMRRGEVLGLTGLAGSGYEMIAQALSGITPFTAGQLNVGDITVNRLEPRALPKLGMAAVPADRNQLGLLSKLSVSENMTLPRIDARLCVSKINKRRERADVRSWIERSGITPSDPRRAVGELSGGNQQKVLMSRALRLDPAIVILAAPTQAVDVGASATIRTQISELASAGRAILVASDNPAELQQICHRVLVTRKGRVVCELVGNDITEERIVNESQFEGRES
jgi:ribose transport system ATP-binding protein